MIAKQESKEVLKTNQLKPVEIDPEVSHEHEFNGINSFNKFRGQYTYLLKKEGCNMYTVPGFQVPGFQTQRGHGETKMNANINDRLVAEIDELVTIASRGEQLIRRLGRIG